jgi:flagellar hook-length control protein FliK
MASALAAVVDIAATAGVPLPVAIPAPVSRAADTTTAATPPSAAAIEIEAGGQPDTPMSGDEDRSQGQGRPSPEFVRFAAALSQAGVIERDDNGRAAAHVAPAPAAPAAPAAATATTVVAAPTAPSTMTPGEENIGRLVQAMRVNARPGAWEATVRLNPEHLGDVTIALRVERNSVTAVVKAEAAGVRQWLETQEQAVRSGMAEHGLHLERFVVQRDGQRRDPQEPERQPPPRKRQPPRDAQGAERFEVHV